MKAKFLGLSLILVIISALNHGSIAVFGLDIIASLFGFSPLFVKALYALIGVAGVYLALGMRNLLAFLK